MDEIRSRLKAPSVQDPSSREIPSSKLRKRSGDQTARTPAHYPEIKTDAWELKESSNGNEPERHPFDLEERTAQSGEALIRFCKKVPRGPENNRLIDQLVGCGTSVGANYCEANEGVSKKDFKCNVGCCVKEAKETKIFLRMIAASEPTLADEARKLYREAKELHLIFVSMYRK